MSESIVLIYSFSNHEDTRDATAVLRKLTETNQSLVVKLINADCSEAELKSQYNQHKQKNSCLFTSMIFAIGQKGLDSLCILNDARFLDSVKIKTGLLIRQYSTKIEELQFTLNFLAIPQSTLDSNAQKIIKSIPNCVLALANSGVSIPIEEETLVLGNIKQIFQATSFDRSMHKLASMTQLAEVFGLSLVAEAMRREYLAPTQAAFLSGALIFSSIYRNSNRIMSCDTSTNNSTSTCKPN